MALTIALQEGVLSDIIAAGKTLDPAAVFVGLFTTGPNVTPPVTAADFTLPNATAMPTQAVTTWHGPYKLNDGRLAEQSPAMLFSLPDDVHAFMAGGWYLADALTGGNILEWFPFGIPVSMGGPLNSVTIVVRVCIPANGVWDASITFNG